MASSTPDTNGLKGKVQRNVVHGSLVLAMIATRDYRERGKSKKRVKRRHVTKWKKNKRENPGIQT
jgi:hypothetical protein